jgi:uncharacterized protein YecA (UPF0149 family)
MQTWLRDACFRFQFEQPEYTLHDYKNFNNRRHYRYRVSLKTKTIGFPKVSLGKYARTEEQAREDVAITMLRRLLAPNGQKIVDYNQHNVELLEDQLQNMAECNFELQLENTALLGELQFLKSKIVM